MSFNDLLSKAKKGLSGSKVYFVAAEFFNLAIISLGITYWVENGGSKSGFISLFAFSCVALLLVTIFGILTRFYLDDNEYRQWPYIMYLISSIIFAGVTIGMSAIIGETVGIVITVIVAIYNILLGIFAISKEEAEYM